MACPYHMFCYHTLYQTQLDLGMSCYCKYSVALPHVLWVGLQCVIVVFSDHAHLLFDILLM